MSVMRKRVQQTLLITAFGILPGMICAGERKDADIVCQPTDETMVYDCMITLKGKQNGAPITDAEFTVGADMPSMPAAHNVKPVPAVPRGMPGMYGARIHLEMFGEWALKLDFTKPNRDRVVKKLHFGDADDHAERGTHTEINHHMKQSE